MKNDFFGSLFMVGITLLFIGLKLAGKITWSWWWVLSPLWISAAIFVITLAVGGLWLWFMFRRK